jgi:hypothetical protein
MECGWNWCSGPYLMADFGISSAGHLGSDTSGGGGGGCCCYYYYLGKGDGDGLCPVSGSDISGAESLGCTATVKGYKVFCL